MKLLLLSTLLCAPAVLATVNGRCSGTFNNGYCICIADATCSKYSHATHIYADGPNNYPCPYDPNNVIGCEIQPCASGNTRCEFTDQCTRDRGTVLPGAQCPGGNNFVCCRRP